jgi:PAS domain S-box-containing protein
VICTAYSDRPWAEINSKLGPSANLLILKKPFDDMEVLQMVQTLTCKWIVTKIAEFRMSDMEVVAEERTYQMVSAREALKTETEQRAEAELARLQAEECFQAAFESSTSALAILAAESLEHKAANRSYFELIGNHRSQVIGHTLDGLDLADQASGLVMALNKIRAGQPVEAMAIEIRRRNGQKRQATISIASMVIGSGKFFLFALHDTTDLRQMEAELRQFQKIECFGQLAGSVAHDFNNILTTLKLGLALVSRNPNLGAESTDQVQQLKENVERAAKLTRQLLVFSRPSVPQIAMVDLQNVVQVTLKMLSQMLGPKVNIQLENQTLTPPLLKADPAMLEQVIMNLVLNARDAMSGEGRLSISIRNVELDSDAARLHPQARIGRLLCLSVADSGEGMDEDTLSHIFEPFFTTKPEGKGTGLGLPTVYRIVKQHQGWIQVESKRGQGSVFHVYFPVPIAAAEVTEILTLPPVAQINGGTVVREGA